MLGQVLEQVLDLDLDHRQHSEQLTSRTNHTCYSTWKSPCTHRFLCCLRRNCLLLVHRRWVGKGKVE